jgi:anti-sigma regulatory factor (Ser/Thr protein kinase)
MSQLYVPNSVNLRNFDSLFHQNDFCFNDRAVDIRFHPKMIALHPVGLAFYAAVGDLLRRQGAKTTARINYDIHTIPFLQRMKLFDALGYSGPGTFVEHDETGRFIPLMKIRTSDELDRFIKTIDPILHTDRENSRVIKHVFSELLRNIIEHSRSPDGGNVCATYNRKRRKVSIGISDAGIGIMQSMTLHHHVTTHRQAIALALRPGVTGTSPRIGGTPENAGAGLFFTKCIAQATRNHFLIYSGDAYFKLWLTPAKEEIQFLADPTMDRGRFVTDLPYFQGTLVGIDIRTEGSEAFNRLIENIGDAFRAAIHKRDKDFHGRIRFR